MAINDLAMGFSDHFVLEAIGTLTENQQRTLTYKEITAACAIPCAERTTIRAIHRLLSRGQIRRSGGGRGGKDTNRERGFTYEIVRDDTCNLGR